MKILLPIDGSKFSDAAVQFVLRQIKPRGTEVRVLHVVEPPSRALEFLSSASNSGVTLVRPFERSNPAVFVTNSSARLVSAAGQMAGYTSVTSAVEQGDPKSKIVEEADKWCADLIVIGSHGRKGLEHFLLGGVSTVVARHARCSVEIVRIPSKR